MTDLATRQLMHRLGAELRRPYGNYSLGAYVEGLVGEVDANAFLAPEESAAFLSAAKEASAALDQLDRAATRLGICLQERAKHTCPTCNRDVPLPAEETAEESDE